MQCIARGMEGAVRIAQERIALMLASVIIVEIIALVIVVILVVRIAMEPGVLLVEIVGMETALELKIVRNIR